MTRKNQSSENLSFPCFDRMRDFKARMSNVVCLCLGLGLCFTAWAAEQDVSGAKNLNAELIRDGNEYSIQTVADLCALQKSGNMKCQESGEKVIFFNACTEQKKNSQKCIFGLLPFDFNKRFELSGDVFRSAKNIIEVTFSSPYRVLDSSDVICIAKNKKNAFVVAIGLFDSTERADGYTYTKSVTDAWIIGKNLKFSPVAASTVSCSYPDRN